MVAHLDILDDGSILWLRKRHGLAVRAKLCLFHGYV